MSKMSPLGRTLYVAALIIGIIVLALRMAGCTGDPGGGTTTITHARTAEPSVTPNDSGWIMLPGATVDPHVCSHSGVCLP